MESLRVSSFSLICLMIVTIIPAALCNYQSFSGRAPQRNPQPKPPVYTLAIQWGLTVCNNRQPFCHSIPKYFTIHGLWLDRQPPPQYCTGKKFDPARLNVRPGNSNETIRQKLDTVWINAMVNNNVKFWRHEYNNHGICANTTVDNFFQMALGAYQTINPTAFSTAVMNEFQNKVNGAIIYSRLKRLLHRDFQMKCKNDNGRYKLQELRLLFSFHSGQWIARNNFKPGDCPPKADIMLPLQ